MINAAKHGKAILDAMLYTKDVASNASNTVTFPKTPYLGLFTTMPMVNADGTYTYTAGVEVQQNSTLANKTYRRVALFSKGVSEKRIMGTAEIVGASSVSPDEAAKDTAAGFSVGAARVSNQDLIFFPEAEKEAYGTIVGFGIFDAVSGGDPYFFGELSGSSGQSGTVTVGLNEIPIFRVGDFRIALE